MTQPQQKEIKYSHVSHVHCWNQVKEYKQELPDCGIPLENHIQCCLCDLKCPQEEWEKEFDEKFFNKIKDSWEYGVAYKDIKDFIRSHKSLWQKEAREEIVDEILKIITEHPIDCDKVATGIFALKDKINSLK